MKLRHPRRIAATLCAAVLPLVAAPCFAAGNLLANPGFDGSLAGWDDWFGSPATYSAVDAGSIDGSGSALISNLGVSNGGALTVRSQCVGVAPTTDYLYGGQAMVPAGQPAGTTAYIFINMHTAAGCDSPPAASDSLSSSLVGGWDALSGSFTTGPEVRSVLFSIAVFKPQGVSADASVHFDNLYLQPSANLNGYTIGASMSGSWYNPAESGHGIMLDLLDGGGAWMCWFAFDLAGNPAWICASGTVSGDTIEFPAAFIVTGGKFPPLFDASKVAAVPWGSITIKFTGCNAGTMQWTTSAPGFQSGSMPLARITTLWGYSCAE
jgi:hypothetical protein